MLLEHVIIKERMNVVFFRSHKTCFYKQYFHVGKKIVALWKKKNERVHTDSTDVS